MTTTATAPAPRTADRITDAVMAKFAAAAKAAGTEPTNAQVFAAFEQLFPASQR
jgi:hypothetical protein